MGMQPTPKYLAAGDRLQLTVTGLGMQRNLIVPSPFAV
jgi:2-keto-4-pentenoate hydratase/2-oxohepta-3-ene-1,7-dioic acid hydratase in catechol pathway